MKEEIKIFTLAQVQQGLRELGLKQWDINVSQLDADATLADMNMDSLQQLDFLMSADEQFGSAVLDKVEAGEIPQPQRLSELAARIVNDLGLVKN